MEATTKTIRCETVTKDGIDYRYELKISESKSIASYGIKLYSVCIEMHNRESFTSNKTGGLFSDKDEAVRFFERLVDNLATPGNLPYIVEDEFSS